ncbi:hypothetical protein KPH14_002602 [Odynerus spinipes]|uniref:Uncharacterized protein n=1 Tax=Odynerus spinipes TaxID=1348599 RepID=A0AAD9R9E8_9HYME|nr:hypothetical protein KPH14_002602 [Odynerus spinipes]
MDPMEKVEDNFVPLAASVVVKKRALSFSKSTMVKGRAVFFSEEDARVPTTPNRKKVKVIAQVKRRYGAQGDFSLCNVEHTARNLPVRTHTGLLWSTAVF